MNEFLPLLIVFALVLLSVASLRLNRAAQPLRLEFAEKSEKLLANPRLPKNLADFVRSLQKMVFSNRGMLIFSIFAVPLMAIAVLVYPKLIERASKRFWIECAETRAQFDEVNRLHDRIMFFNNPILLLVVAFEMVLLVAPAVLLYAIIRGAVSVQFNQDVVRNLIEEKSIKFRSAVPKLSFAHTA